MKINKIQKTKNLIKESINNKKSNSVIDTNIYIDKLRYDENPYSINDIRDHINKKDVNELILFFINH
jgi:hypothetical protein